MKTPSYVEDRSYIVDTINHVTLSADMRDWARVRAQFADASEAKLTLKNGARLPGQVDVIPHEFSGKLAGITGRCEPQNELT